MMMSIDLRDLLERALPQGDPESTEALLDLVRTGNLAADTIQLFADLVDEGRSDQPQEVQAARMVVLGHLYVSVGKLEWAVDSLRQAEKLAPRCCEASLYLSGLFVRHDLRAVAISTLEDALARAAGPAERKLLALRVAELVADDSARAVEFLEIARKEDPTDLALLRELDAHATALDDVPRLQGILGAELRVTTDRTERAHLLYRLGILCEERLLSLRRATRLFQEAVGLDPDHEDAHRALARCLRSQRRLPEALDALLDHADCAADGTLRLEVTRRALRLAVDDLRDDRAAAACAMRVCDLCPDDIEAVAAGARAFAALGDGPKAQALEDRLASLALSFALPDPLDPRLASTAARALTSTAERNDADDPRWAVQALELATRLDPTQAQALAALVRIHEREGRPTAAERWLTRLVDRVAGPDRARLLVRLADLRTRLCDPEGALQALVRAHCADPADGHLALRLSIAHSTRGDHAAAEPILRRAISRAQGSAKADLERGLACTLLSMGRALEALVLVRRLATERRSDAALARLHVEIALAHAPERGEVVRALRHRRALVDPCSAEHAELLVEEAKVELGRGEPAAAARLLSRLADEQASPEILELLLEAHGRLGNEAAALEAQLALALAAPEELVMERLDAVARLALAKGLVAHAARCVELLVEADPESRRACFLAAAVNARRGEPAGIASAMLRLAEVESDPQAVARALRVAGDAFVELGAYGDAAAAFERALGADDELHDAFDRLEQCLSKLGAHERIEAVLSQRIARVEGARAADLGLRLGRVRVTLARHRDAAHAFATAAATAPSAELRRAVASIWSGAGEHALAIEELSRAAELEPMHVPTLVALARAYDAAGEPGRAEAIATVAHLLCGQVVESQALSELLAAVPFHRNGLAIDRDHPELVALLAAITPTVLHVLARPAATCGPARLDHRTAAFFDGARRVAAQFGLEVEVRVDPRPHAAVSLTMGARRPVLWIGPGAWPFAGPKDAAFLSALWLARVPGRSLLPALLPAVGDLRAMVAAALAAADPRARLSGDAAILGAALDPSTKSWIRAGRFTFSELSAQCAEYAQAHERRAWRAALVTEADFTQAMRLARSEPLTPGGLGVGQRIEELVRTVLFATRRELEKSREVAHAA